jgi:hypothetical protein
MRSKSLTDTNLLLSTVTVLALVMLVKLPEFLQSVGYRLADLWSLVRQIW